MSYSIIYLCQATVKKISFGKPKDKLQYTFILNSLIIL